MKQFSTSNLSDAGMNYGLHPMVSLVHAIDDTRLKGILNDVFFSNIIGPCVVLD